MFRFKVKLKHFLGKMILKKLHSGYLITISVVFLILSVGLLFIIYEKQKDLTRPAAENEIWASHKLESEVLKLSQELILFKANSSTLNSVQLRFEILYSRANVLNTGKLKKIIETIPEANKVLKEIIENLNNIDFVVFSKESEFEKNIPFFTMKLKIFMKK